MPWLSVVTTLVNLTGLLVALWLGLFLVTRSPRSRISWMGALTVWAIGTWFLHNALQGGITTHAWTDWLGQVMKLSIPLMFHLTCLLRFAIAPPRPALRRLMDVVIVLSYVLVVFQIVESSGIFGASVSPGPASLAVLFRDRWTTSTYPLFLTVLIVLPLLAIFNLAQGRRQTDHPLVRRQMSYLIVAAVVGYLGALYAGFGALLQAPIPAFPADAILTISVLILGYAVASYSALLEGRWFVRDAVYSALGLLTVVAVYSVVTLLLRFDDQITLQALVAVLIIAVITHALYDGGRSLLDRLFYHSNSRRLRAELRALATEAGLADSLSEQLTRVLVTVCRTLHVTRGFIAVYRQEALVVQAATAAEWRTRTWSLVEAEALGLTDDEVFVPDGSELEEMALLVPLLVGPAPVGILGLGPQESGGPFRLEDLEYVETLAEQLALMIRDAQQQTERVQALDQLVGEFRAQEREVRREFQGMLAQRVPHEQPPDATALPPHPLAERLEDEDKLMPLVADALRHLHDYAYLGRHSLVDLQVVQQYLPQPELDGEQSADGLPSLTHVDRGKALYELLVKTIESLQPGDGTSDPPGRHDVAPREWRPYLILHESYVTGEPTNEIMARLYIGEGTYYRARRSALHSVTKSLQELEHAYLLSAVDAG